jgi:quercetin dioxygenase-like cupin family protein
MKLLVILGALAAASGQTVVTNLDSAKWEHEKGAADGSEAVLLRTDPGSGGMDLLVRFPAGHVIPPHFHDSNEHVIVVEGELTLHQDSGDTPIKTGGFAFLPAKEAQRLSCTSKTRCTFYLSWDGNPKSHPVK